MVLLSLRTRVLANYALWSGGLLVLILVGQKGGIQLALVCAVVFWAPAMILLSLFTRCPRCQKPVFVHRGYAWVVPEDVCSKCDTALFGRGPVQ